MIAVLDFGGQYTHLIARRLRDLHVPVRLYPHDTPASALKDVDGIVFSGGPSSVYAPNAPKPDSAVFDLGKPILGLCYGHQFIANHFGGKVERATREYGERELAVVKKEGVLAGVQSKEKVWYSHGDSVLALPSGFETLAKSGDSFAAYAYVQTGKRIYGLQFHPEVHHTPCGNQVLENFAFIICKVKKTKDTFSKMAMVEQSRTRVGPQNVVIGVSGGVDSTVAAFLLRDAFAKQLFPIYVDTGLMRQNETEEIKAFYSDFPNFVFVDASKEFLTALKGVSEPEQKRKIIGHLFIEVFEKAAQSVPNVGYLAQGTIFSDRVESAATGGKATSKIKSHHNLTLPEKMKWQVLEPLAELYKDEVRALGKQLGVPDAILKRHPFPGPGLAINIVGEVTPDRLKAVRQADFIFIEELRKAGWYDKMFEAFAAILPCRTVGVKGDERSYEYPIVLRAVESKDVMTADWVRLPPELLQTVASRILGEVEGVNRVFYDISQKPPATIRYE
ncbi:glutamine-hydrolyzing GMP synthase [Candidatus Micrarchaeota archaeon]|nr:glutamine-hydrolyzing GMP synthase [Candidatus Micrarchaeota archaeon]